MIIIENIELNGTTFIHTYSNSGVYIRKSNTDEYYLEAYDNKKFEYIETEMPIEIETI